MGRRIDGVGVGRGGDGVAWLREGMTHGTRSVRGERTEKNVSGRAGWYGRRGKVDVMGGGCMDGTRGQELRVEKRRSGACCDD